MQTKKKYRVLHHSRAIMDEVDKLLAAGAIQEVFYPEWLANTVVVKKKNGKWRVCIDYTDLNRSCPKNSYSLPKIDQLVDATVGAERMSFLDAYSGYHQIPLHQDDREKTSFITPRGNYCYRVMPFGLKNAGSTYQCMITKLCSEHIGNIMEVYIDDMVVKSKDKRIHLTDLQSVFNTLRKYELKLNATKCAFGVSSGKFLGFLVTHRDIEDNPSQIQAIMTLARPTTIKDVQKLACMAVALNRFISRSAD